MKAAVVFDLAEGPVWADFIDPQPAPGQTLIDVRAAAISHVVKGPGIRTPLQLRRQSALCARYRWRRHHTLRASASTSPSPPPLRQYGAAGAGRLQNCLPLPDALDDIQAAAMANPGMSAWASLVTRAQLQAGETVLINGATGSAGQLAVQIARYLGAKKIIATGRNAQSLAALDADECIQLTADNKTLSGQFSAVSAAPDRCGHRLPVGTQRRLLLPALAKYTLPAVRCAMLQVGSPGWRRYRVKWRSAAFRPAPADGQRYR